MVTPPDLSKIDNPMWEAVRGRVKYEPMMRCTQVGTWDDVNSFGQRREVIDRYAWSVTDPLALAFVVEHIGPRALDPLAGTGYWGYLLRQAGVDVASSDLYPPDLVKNRYHPSGITHSPVLQRDAVEAVTVLGEDRTLFLSWVPYEDPIGAKVLLAYTGCRVILVGESWGGCCGDDALFEELETNWVEVATHRPVQFLGIRDDIAVYTRARPG